MTRCPAHGNRTGLAPPAPPPDCRRIRRQSASSPTSQGSSVQGRLWRPGAEAEVLGVIALAGGINGIRANPSSQESADSI